jgi:hypothetical protein
MVDTTQQIRGFIISVERTEQDTALYLLEVYRTSQGERTILVGNLLDK